MSVLNPFLRRVQRKAEHEDRIEKMKLAWLAFCDRLEDIKRRAEQHDKNV
jgi:hypothetical protein